MLLLSKQFILKWSISSVAVAHIRPVHVIDLQNLYLLKKTKHDKQLDKFWCIVMYLISLTYLICHVVVSRYHDTDLISSFEICRMALPTPRHSDWLSREILLRKVHPESLSHKAATVCASIECLKRNRTSRILCGQVTFFRYLSGDKAEHFHISTPL